MKHRKRLVSFLCLLSLLFCLSACSSNVPQTETSEESHAETTKPVKVVQKQEIPGLCYDAGQSLSPYVATSRVNLQLVPFLYEGLYTITENWETKPCLLGTVKKNSATLWTITLRKDAKFSGGKAVKPSDVVTSFHLAEKSDTYRSLVSCIDSVKAEKNALVVSFAYAAPWRERALSFPIVSGEQGTGPYRFQKKDHTLVKNPYAKEEPAIPVWRLENVSRSSEQQYAAESQMVSLYFTDLQNQTAPQTITTLGMKPVTIPYLVYLGINSGRTAGNSLTMRKAFSEAISQTAICDAAGFGYGEVASGIFPPTMEGVSDLVGFSPNAQPSLAKTHFQEKGYLTKKGEKLKVTLICPKGNASLAAAAKEVASELKELGISVSLQNLDAQTYRSRLAYGDYDLYVAEVRLPNTLSLDALLTSGGNGSYGVTAKGKEAYLSFRKGSCSAEEFHKVFMGEIPLIPLFWKQGLAVHSPQLTDFSLSGASIFQNIAAWQWN